MATFVRGGVCWAPFVQSHCLGRQGQLVMNIKIGPAKRPGLEKTILEQPLNLIEVDVNGDDVQLRFCAGCLYDNKSLYRYTMRFSRSEMLDLLADGPTS